MFEKIITDRLIRHLSWEGPNLSDGQYGFRQGRSTVDAIRVRSLSESIAAEGGVALAVSLDIANAFNSLLWEQVRRALQHHRVPPYLAAAIGDYFRDRKLMYVDRDAITRERGMSCGVPQGSVLGLWNFAFDTVLRSALPPGSSVVCYADDTLVLAGGGGTEKRRPPPPT